MSRAVVMPTRPERAFWSALLQISMSSSVAYLFAASYYVADFAVRKQGWQQRSRAGWQTPEGQTVHFICFEEQLAIVPDDATIYVIGRPPAALRHHKSVSAIAA